MELAIPEGANEGVETVPVPLFGEVAMVGTTIVVFVEPAMHIATRMAGMGIDHGIDATDAGIPGIGVASGRVFDSRVYHVHNRGGLGFPVRDTETQGQSFGSSISRDQAGQEKETGYYEQTQIHDVTSFKVFLYRDWYMRGILGASRAVVKNIFLDYLTIPPGGYYDRNISSEEICMNNSREKIERRLKIIAGQVRGLQEMVEKDAYCIDIITQTSAVKQALTVIEDLLMESHLSTCVIKQIKGGKEEKAVAEILKVYRLKRK